MSDMSEHCAFCGSPLSGGFPEPRECLGKWFCSGQCVVEAKAAAFNEVHGKLERAVFTTRYAEDDEFRDLIDGLLALSLERKDSE